jgi:flagellar basal body-associated protein FliL
MNVTKILLLVGVGTASAVAGVAIPFTLSGGTKVTPADVAHEKTDAAHDTKKADSHAKKTPAKADSHAKPDAHGKDAGAAKGDAPAVHAGPSFVPFGRIVVNLNEPTLTKYLTLEITLQVDGKDTAAVTSAVEERMPVLRTWLTAHLADKSMDDVRGKVGVNRMRREIQDQFNALLFEDGRERVTDVLFEEFHVE